MEGGDFDVDYRTVCKISICVCTFINVFAEVSDMKALNTHAYNALAPGSGKWPNVSGLMTVDRFPRPATSCITTACQWRDRAASGKLASSNLSKMCMPTSILAI